MKVKVKAPFFDERGIHKVGEEVDVKEFNPLYHERNGYQEGAEKDNKKEGVSIWLSVQRF